MNKLDKEFKDMIDALYLRAQYRLNDTENAITADKSGDAKRALEDVRDYLDKIVSSVNRVNDTDEWNYSEEAAWTPSMVC